MKIQSMTVHFDGTVTLWLEGQDSMSDYFPAVHSCRQKDVPGYITSSGMTDSCYIHGTNHRDAGQAWDKDHKSALRLSKRWGVRFQDQVRFPTRDTKEAAEADANLEADVATEVIFKGSGWVDGGTRYAEMTWARVTI